MQKVVVERFILPTTLLGISVGIILRIVLHLGVHFVVFVLMLLVSSLVLMHTVQKDKVARFVFVILVAFLLSTAFGLVRTIHVEKGFRFSEYAGESVRVSGKVVREPEKRESYLLLVVQADSIVTDVICEVVSEHIIVRSDLYEQVSYGDSVLVFGQLDVPEPFLTEHNRMFFYDNYLRKDGVGTIVSFASVEVLSSREGSALHHFLFEVKESYLSSIARHIPDPEVSLLGGLTVGTKQSLGSELENKFRTTGIIHIVVLSGYNVIIIAETLIRSFRSMPVRMRLIVSTLAVALFVILVGAGATVVRAAIMAIAALAVRTTGRTAIGIQLLFLAGIMMPLINPLILLYDPSFQLSFIATLGLICLSKPIGSFFVGIKNRALREITTATVATQIAVFPFLMYLIGEVSLVSLPVNLLVLPTVPLAMLLGFITGIFGVIPFVSMFLGPLFGALAFFALSYQLLVIDIFSKIPFSAVAVPPLFLSHVALIYALLVFVVWKFHNRGSAEQVEQSGIQ